MGLRTQQLRTIKLMNMHICSGEDCDRNVWPRLEPTFTIPNGLTTFEVASSWKHTDEFCHFFIDDYRFERLWDRPESYLDILSRYSGLIAPDFSTYIDMPLPMQIWNVYRSRALAYCWQQQGFDVIPNIQFSDENSYEWVFEGLPKHSVLATSSVGVYRNSIYRKEFKRGMEEACRRLEPIGLVMYGSKVDFDANGADVYWYKNDNHERLKRWEERQKESGNVRKA